MCHLFEFIMNRGLVQLQESDLCLRALSLVVVHAGGQRASPRKPEETQVGLRRPLGLGELSY